MTRAMLLRAAATASTVVALLASVAYVAAHPKDPAAPLQPPVVRSIAPSAPPEGRLRIAPGVRATDVPAVTSTHVS